MARRPATLSVVLGIFVVFSLFKSLFQLAARHLILRAKYAVQQDLMVGTFSDFFHARWHFFASDPRDDLRRIDTPVFAIFAGADDNVPWRRHLPALVAALAAGGNADVATVVLPDQDHFFLELDGRRVAKHSAGEMRIADEMFAALDAELGRRGLVCVAQADRGGRPAGSERE